MGRSRRAERRSKRRWQWLLAPMALPAALVVGLCLGTILFLATDAGKQFVVHQALRLANGAFPGSISVDDAAIHWLSAVELEGVSAAAPDGTPVFDAARVVIRYRLLPLIRGRLLIRRIRVERPVLVIAWDAQGDSNLDRFLGPSPASPAPPSEPWDGRLPVDVTVSRIEIAGGTFLATDARSKPTEVARLEGIDLDATYTATGPVHRVTMAPLEATFLEPDMGRATLDLDGTYDLSQGLDNIRLDKIHLIAEGLEARGIACFTGFDWPVGEVALKFDRIDAAFMKRFDPTLPVREGVRLALALATDESKHARARISLRLPEGRLDGMGDFDLSHIEEDLETLGYDIRIAASGLRVDSVLDLDLPPLNPLSFRLTSTGKGVTPTRMDTRFEVNVAPISYRGYQTHGGRISGRLAEGVVAIDASHIESPYATLDAQGFVALDGPVRATVTLTIPDLSRPGHRLALPVEGDLSAQARISGTVQAPVVALSFSSRRLAYGPPGDTIAFMEHLAGTGTIRMRDDRGNPMLQAEVEARVARAGFPDPRLKDLEATIDYDGTIAVTLTGKDVYDQPLHVALTYDLEEETTVTIDALSLPLGATPWRLQAPMTVRIQGDDILVDPFTLSGADGYLSGSVVYRPAGDNDILVVTKGLRLDNAAPYLQDDLPGIRGELAMDARVTGPAAAPSVAASIRLLEFSAGDIPLLDARLHLAVENAADPRLTGMLAVDFHGGGDVEAKMAVPARVTLAGDASLLPGSPLDAAVRLAGVDLSQLSPLLSDPVEALAGTVDGTLTLGGTTTAPLFEGTVSATQVSGFGPHPLDARVKTRYGGGNLHVEGLVRSPVLGPIPLLFSRFDIPLRITATPEIVPMWHEAVSGSLAIPAQKLAQFSAVEASLERVKGDIQLMADIRGRLADPSVRVDLRGRGVRPPGYPPVDFDIEAGYSNGQAGTVARVQVAGSRPAHLEASVHLPLARILQGGDASLSHLEARLEVPELNFLDLPAILRGPQVTGGALTMNAYLSCPERVPVFSGKMDIVGLSMGETQHDIAFAFHFADESLRLHGTIRGSNGKEADMSGVLPLELTLPLDASDATVAYPQGLDIDTNFRHLDLTVINAMMPSDIRFEGTMSGRLHLSGSLESPVGRGHIDLTDAVLYYPEYGLLYRDIGGRVRLTPTQLMFENITMKSGKGMLDIGGVMALADSVPETMDIDARAQNFLLMDGPYGRMRVDGALHVGGTAAFPDITGELTIPSAVIKLPDFASTLVMELSGLEKPKALAPEELPASIHVLTNDGPVTWHTYETGEQSEESPFEMNADVTIHIPRDFWVQNESQEVVVELSGDVRYLVEKEIERMEGEIRTVRGEINLFTQPLTVSDGTIAFTGTPGIDPALDIVSRADTLDYGSISLKISGRSSSPVVTFDSENGYDPADILAILIIGKPLSESHDPNDSIKVASQVESLAAGVLAGIARKQLADKIPLDYLEIKADSFSSADLRVGKYITPKLFVSYKRKLTTDETAEENINEVRAEYQLSRNLYLESFYGDAGIWGGDINWRKNY